MKGKIPEFWNPISGERTRAMVYQTNEETISVPVQLEAYGSVFVVFRSDLPEQKAIRSIHKDGKCLIDASAISTEEWKQAAYPDIRDNFSISLWVKPEQMPC